MGNRAHIVVDYKCEYGGCAFNWAADEVYAMLRDNDVEVWQSDEHDNYCDWEIRGVDELRKFVRKLKKLPPDEPNVYFKEKTYPETNQYVADTFTY